jgi:hypothetical protein
MGLQTFYGYGPHPLLRAGPPAAPEKLTVSGTPNRLNYCVSSVAQTQFTNVVVGSITQPEARGLDTHALKQRFPKCVPRDISKYFFLICVY